MMCALMSRSGGHLAFTALPHSGVRGDQHIMKDTVSRDFLVQEALPKRDSICDSSNLLLPYKDLAKVRASHKE